VTYVSSAFDMHIYIHTYKYSYIHTYKYLYIHIYTYAKFEWRTFRVLLISCALMPENLSSHLEHHFPSNLSSKLTFWEFLHTRAERQRYGRRHQKSQCGAAYRVARLFLWCPVTGRLSHIVCVYMSVFVGVCVCVDILKSQLATQCTKSNHYRAYFWGTKTLPYQLLAPCPVFGRHSQKSARRWVYYVKSLWIWLLRIWPSQPLAPCHR